MDLAILVAAFAACLTAGFMLGRVWGLKEFIDLLERHEELRRKHQRLTDRDALGRFIGDKKKVQGADS